MAISYPIGHRLVQELTLIKRTHYETRDDKGGTKTLHRYFCRDTNNNGLVYTGNDYRWKIGESLFVRFTVKRFERFGNDVEFVRIKNLRFLTQKPLAMIEAMAHKE